MFTDYVVLTIDNMMNMYLKLMAAELMGRMLLNPPTICCDFRSKLSGERY